MEECEALCTRLVIMVNGEFKCLGSPQHLKTKFGNGYKLSIRLNDEVSNTEALFKFMKENFPASLNTETHKNLFEYILPFNSTKLSQIFGTIEKNREILNIKDYSVTQTTLDQIFVNFAKSQNEEAFGEEKFQNESESQFTAFNSPTFNLNNNISNNNEIEDRSVSSASSAVTSKNILVSERTSFLNNPDNYYFDEELIKK